MTKRKNYLVVCREAGGAELISEYIISHRENSNLVSFVSGPAKRIFASKKIPHHIVRPNTGADRILDASDGTYSLLVSVGWTSPFELRLLKKAKAAGVHSIVYIDHWINYRERFGYPRTNWTSFLPNEIWVGDRFALKKAQREFPSDIPIRLIRNDYFGKIRKSFKKYERHRGKPKRILFLSEPLSGNVNSFGDKSRVHCTEYDVLEDILKSIARQHKKPSVIIRFHPSESHNKYNEIIRQYADVIRIFKSSGRSIVHDLARSYLIIGMDSVALMIAKLCGKNVISYIPDRSYACTIPDPRIKKIKSFTVLQNLLT
ncbi:MAG: hypothetical protein A3B30_04435 [Candidatus Komeilibacteria bacterium RIFCSPLOWO2_01_FULL_52_15]|uniref:Uncharacterized protein n=2 Tax=Candidatus Komeiliibacteriota TaxID=1817908 RepID=A0A1G2BPV2_9BACT|nr:MAG: hypothetical protein A2677_04195 [Candidatus Komeilibacteria bacterium RIFCSPHIGHO2_01_FULL_52_14]OGY91128.1 MAG: hypothetical protein A3B30_04435 [Candidatus Komeilibacteria bacterium RIFCSPLOWO2_01_FULL_52_15]